MGSNQGRRFPPEVYTPEEIQALLGACKSSTTGRRDRALVVVLYRCGLRVSEALALHQFDIDRRRRRLRVRCGKGGKARTVGIDAKALLELGAWLDARDRLVAERGLVNPPLFCTHTGRALCASYVRRLLPRLGRRAGIAKRIHAHGLRHTFAMELADEGMPVPQISALLGHARCSTTDAYVRALGADAAIARAGERAAW